MSKKNQRSERINEEIKASKVRITGKDIESRIVYLSEALRIAEDMGVDLVEISSQEIPVCKLIDYSKFLYERKMKEKENAKKNKNIKLKELRFTYNTGDHDFNFKLKHAENFLKDGDKVKAYVFFKGREIDHKEIGELLLLKFVDALSGIGKPESLPKLEGNRMIVIINPV
jgi:translation initiation factor IF-3